MPAVQQGGVPPAGAACFDAKTVCCGQHDRPHAGDLAGGAHISRCVTLQALLRPCVRGPAQQLVLLVRKRLDVYYKLQDGLQVLPAVQQLHVSLQSAAFENLLSSEWC